MNFTELNRFSLVKPLLNKISFLDSNELKSKKEIFPNFLIHYFGVIIF